MSSSPEHASQPTGTVPATASTSKSNRVAQAGETNGAPTANGARRSVPTVLLAAHGTRDPAGAAEAFAFAERLAARLAPDYPLAPCFLELTDPPILDTIDRLAADGTREIVVVPLMLFGAAHVKNDVPAAIAAARLRHPGLTIKYGTPLGVQPEMLDVVDERLRAVERESSARASEPSSCEPSSRDPFPREKTAVLVVERGSSDPGANAQVFHLARMIWEGRGFGWVEACFIGITRPSLDEGLARCLALGAERVIVLPYFLFTGVLVRRIAETVARHAASLAAAHATPEHPGIALPAAARPTADLRVAEHLGAHPRLLDLLARRVSEAVRGSPSMTCDCCIYRAPLVGFGHRVGQPQRSDGAHGLRTGGALPHDHGGRRA